MDAKTEMMTAVVNKLMIALGQDACDTATYIIEEALLNYDIIRAERSLVLHDDSDKAYVGRFFVAKTALGLSPKTLGKYRTSIRCFLQTVQKHIKDITTDDIRLYLLGLKMRGCSEVTRNNTRLDLSSFFAFLRDENIIDDNPMLRIKKIREPKLVKEPFSEREVELLRSKPKRLRDRAIVEFLISSACRVGEIVALDKTDIDWQNHRALVKGKGNKYRFVYLTPRCETVLAEYLDSRDDQLTCLFASARRGWNERISAAGLGRMIRDLGKELGIDKVHPHRFRRTSATMALRRGMPIEQVSKILGHSNLNTTTIYANSTEDDLAIAHKRFLS